MVITPCPFSSPFSPGNLTFICTSNKPEGHFEWGGQRATQSQTEGGEKRRTGKRGVLLGDCFSNKTSWHFFLPVAKKQPHLPSLQSHITYWEPGCASQSKDTTSKGSPPPYVTWHWAYAGVGALYLSHLQRFQPGIRCCFRLPLKQKNTSVSSHCTAPSCFGQVTDVKSCLFRIPKKLKVAFIIILSPGGLAASLLVTSASPLPKPFPLLSSLSLNLSPTLPSHSTPLILSPRYLHLSLSPLALYPPFSSPTIFLPPLQLHRRHPTVSASPVPSFDHHSFHHRFLLGPLTFYLSPSLPFAFAPSFLKPQSRPIPTHDIMTGNTGTQTHTHTNHKNPAAA